MTRILISHGNSKLGKTPNISLPPHTTCVLDAPCRKDCYANNHAYRLYPNVRQAWDANLEAWTNNPGWYEARIRNYLAENKPKYFRWHVGGDMPDRNYAEMVERIATVFPETSFLIFTRRIWLERVLLPANLHVMRSQWPGESVDTMSRKFIVLPKGEDVLDDGILCPGKCEGCRACWMDHGCPIYTHKH
jgi:hypothetical protein